MQYSHLCAICGKGIDPSKQGYQVLKSVGSASGMVHNKCAGYVDEVVEEMAPSKKIGVQKGASMDELNVSPFNRDVQLAKSQWGKGMDIYLQADGVINCTSEDMVGKGMLVHKASSQAGSKQAVMPQCILCHSPIFPDDDSVLMQGLRGKTDIMHKSCLADKLNGKVDYSNQRSQAATRLRTNK